MRIVFLGTPEFAVNCLDALVNSKHEVVAVVCQPDKPTERGNKIVFSEVKKYAIDHDIPLFQFPKISRDGLIDLRALEPDLMVTAAYGQILSQEVLDIAKYGVINVHASLLPKYRGASPLQNAILNGDEMTGVTIMKVATLSDYEAEGGYLKGKLIRLDIDANSQVANQIYQEVDKGFYIE